MGASRLARMRYQVNSSPDIKLWYRSDFGITLVSGKVVEWKPMLGLGTTITQGTEALAPTLSGTDSPLSQAIPAVVSNGTQFLTGVTTFTSSVGRSWTCFAVTRVNSTGDYRNVFDSQGQGPMLWKNGANFAEFNTNAGWGYTFSSTRWLTYPSIMTSVQNTTNTTGGAVPIQPWDTAARYRVNGAQRNMTSTNDTVTGEKSFSLMNRAGGIGPLSGAVYEFICIGRRLESAELQRFERYLKRRYRGIES